MTKPDNRASSDSDPFVEPYWTLAMAAAWVIWRKSDKVLEVAHFQRARVFDGVNDRVRPDDAVWPDDDRVREFERRPHTGSLFDVLNEAAREPADQVLTSKEAREALWAALQSGELTAWGIPIGLADLEEIPKHGWIELTYFEPSKGGNDAIGNNDREVKFLRVRVRSKDVLRIWSAVIDGTGATTKLSAEISGTGTNIPKFQAKILEVAKTIWPDGVYPVRVADRNRAILAEFKRLQGTEPSSKTIQRAMARRGH